MPWSSHERIAGAVLALLVAGAFALRLDGITTAPFELHATRQYHSALLARTIYLDGADNLPAWKERVLDALDEQETVIEPPVMEVLAVGGYHLAGGERLWIPRLLSSLWWVCGALLLYRVARRVAGPPGSLVAVAAYLFMPYAVLASRSFQPDPLMVVSIVAATLAMLRYHERPTDRRLSTAMLVCALALLVKPGVASPFVFAVFAFLAVQRAGLRRAVASSRHYIFAAAALPMFLYWGYGRYVADFLSGHVQDKLAPSLLSQWSFWNGWRLQFTHVLTYPRTEEVVAGVVAILCLVGVVTARRGTARTLLLALWVGYLGLGLIFTFHIHTHTYYSLPAVPIVALSLGALCDGLLARLGNVRAATFMAGGAVVVGALVVSLALHPRLASPEPSRVAARYERIGLAADHAPNALFVDRYYGAGVSYHGWMAGRYVLTGFEPPKEVSGVLDAAAQLGRAGAASCLIVTDGVLLRQYAGLVGEAARRFAVRRLNGDFAIFDVRPARRSEGGACA